MNDIAKKTNLFFIMICLLFHCFSCATNKAQYGFAKIKRNKDTLTSQREIAEIRNVSAELFEADSLMDKNKVQLRYRILKPKNHTISVKKFPLVIVFHGSGAIGNDNEAQLGLLAKMWATEDIRKKYPAYIIAPQFESRSSNYISDSKRKILVSKPESCLQSVLQLIDVLKQQGDIDTHKIYVIGFSMGASTVINAINLRPELFAAAISISGIPQFNKNPALNNMPIWLLHGNVDIENPILSDVEFYKEYHNKQKIRFWEFDGIGHDNIFLAIPFSAIPQWMFNQKKS